MSTEKYVVTGMKPESKLTDKFIITYGPRKEAELDPPCEFKDALESMKKYVRRCLMYIDGLKDEYESLKRENPNPDVDSIEYDELKDLKQDIEDTEFFELPVLLNSVTEDYEEDDLFVFVKNEGVVKYDLIHGWSCNPELIPISVEEFEASVSEIGILNHNNSNVNHQKLNTKKGIWCNPNSICTIK